MNRQQDLWRVLKEGMRRSEGEYVSELNAVDEAFDASTTSRADQADVRIAAAFEDASQTRHDLTRIATLTSALDAKYRDRLVIEPSLSRKLVSFQANKQVPLYRWYKYKEGYSAELVDKFLSELELPVGRVLDPFAGAGTTMFVAASKGLDADGIELLPIGQEIISTRASAHKSDVGKLAADVKSWAAQRFWQTYPEIRQVHELRITSGAYPPETQDSIERYLGALEQAPHSLRPILRLALLAVLETVSYTRKDGQYLRWDHRSPRVRVRGSFDKGPIPTFDVAISMKLLEIVADLNLVNSQACEKENLELGETRLLRGSCLDILPTLAAESYGAVITSPPYCNRYDYTRTYALEHALLGQTEEEVSKLRQAMLTCTVENREKALSNINPQWDHIVGFARSMSPLKEIVDFLQGLASSRELNNTNIPRMVRGYFSEMACVIYEFARLLAPGGYVVMVNDNVRYAGANIHVDTILSAIAEQVGLTTERILISPQNKGNSSQQMGAHGREPLRKSVYVWRKV
jgi:DNA modification methylase